MSHHRAMPGFKNILTHNKKRYCRKPLHPVYISVRCRISSSRTNYRCVVRELTGQKERNRNSFSENASPLR